MPKDTTYKVLPASQIHVADRLREELGPLGGMSESMQHVGVLEPLLVELVGSRHELLAGERRLRAAVLAGLAEVPVIVYKNLTPAERVEIELTENLHRKDLTPHELSKRTLDAAEKVPAVMCAVQQNSPKGGRKAQRGVSGAAVAERLGVDRATLHRAKKHVEAVEKHPDLEKLSQKAALKEYARREGKAKEERKRKKPEPTPQVVKVSEYKFAGEYYGMMDRFIADGHHQDRNEVLIAGLTLYYAREYESKPAPSSKPTPPEKAAPSLPTTLAGGIFIRCDVCGKEMRRFDARKSSKGVRGHSECIRKAA